MAFSQTSLTAVALGVAAFFVFSTLLGKLLAGKSKQHPPGPKPLPLIGNLHQVPKSLQWFHYYNWSKVHGPVMFLNLAGQPFVILSTVNAAQDLLSQRSAQYSDRPRMVMAGELVTKGMQILLRPYDAQYRLHQRMEAPLLNKRASECYRALQEMESRQLLIDALKSYQSEGEGGVDPHHLFERAMGSFIYCILYGYRFKTGQEKELRDAQRCLSEFVEAARVGSHIVDVMPLLNYLPKPLAPWKRKAEELYDLEANLHIANLRKGLENPGWNFSKSMNASKEAEDMSEVELAYDLGILANAALDTTAITLDWFVVAWLTQGSSWAVKAQRILDEVVGRDRLPQWEDRSKLVYIEAIVSEVMRWCPTVTDGVPHATKKADIYGDYMIPANSTVLANHYAIARDETVFGSDPDSLIPDRWIDESGQLKNLPIIGFGFGRRACTGKHIARNNLFIQVARIMWAFDIEPAMRDGKKHEIDPWSCTEGFVTQPRPFKAVFRPRQGNVESIIRGLGTTHWEDHVTMLDRIGDERKVKT